MNSNVVTFEFIGSLIVTAFLTAVVTNMVTKYLCNRRNHSGQNLNESGQNLNEKKLDEIYRLMSEAIVRLAKLEELPEKLDRTNELLAQIKGILSVDHRK